MINSKPKNIIYISYDGVLENIGQSQIKNYLLKLSKTFTIELITFEKKIYLKDKIHFEKTKNDLERNGITWKYFIYERKFFIGFFINFNKLFFYLLYLALLNNKINYHCRSLIPSIACYFISFFVNIKFIFDMRGFWIDEKSDRFGLKKSSFIYFFFKKLESKIINKCSHIITLTNDAKSIILNSFPELDNEKIYVIPTCVDTEYFKPINLNKSITTSITLCYLGTIDGAYDIAVIINYFNNLKSINKNFKLRIYTKQINELKKILSFSSNVENIEYSDVFRDEIVGELNNVDIGVFYLKDSFSIKGSFPTKIGEFLALGKPIICNNFNNDIESILKDHKIGIISAFNNNDIGVDVKLINHFINNRELLIDKCRNFSINNISIEIGSTKLSKIYKRTFF